MPPSPRGGATVVAVTWAVAGAVHLWIALDAAGAAVVLGFALAAVAFVGAAALIVEPRPELLVAAAVTGVIGVGAFAIPLILPLLGIGDPVADPVSPWGIGGFLVDGLTVRLAAFTLRRARASRPSPPAGRNPGTPQR
ncbi:hypothetical protein GCM10017691_20770 [Pseudonocardia petroleophila]|uniref:SPW repeat-containing protein n=2 Tax=Pseudonocardia petroleophila TaxID=37331 RepID=A0A7G7MGN2_9PSEU|nr:hypothetical protein [Pseudonocardia petroleophila]QNG51943.1 hypothetical protein H6H00_28285 [Pseudonocardia petroleophila]